MNLRNYPIPAFYYSNALYMAEDEQGIFHAQYGRLTSTNRGCTKVEILNVELGKHYFEILVRYPGRPESKWTLYANELRTTDDKHGWRRKGIGFELVAI